MSMVSKLISQYYDKLLLYPLFLDLSFAFLAFRMEIIKNSRVNMHVV